MYVEKEWYDTVRKILAFYLDESPEHRIAVLIREQDNSDDISHPSITPDGFMNKLFEGKVRWNELYFIER